VLEFDDDAESRETTEGSGSLVDAPSIGSEGRSEDDQETTSGLSTPVTPVIPGIKPVEHDSQHQLSARLLGHDAALSGAAERQPLLALRISRTGHLFAVITSTSLTIWQTKV
jgi:RAB6A-GEF complex partner protein 1